MAYLILFTALNIFLFSNAEYIGTPKKAADLRATLKRPLVLKCKYTGADNDGQFIGWYKNDTLINNDKPEHYVVTTTKNESKLNITFTEEDQNIQKWSVKTTKPDHEEPIRCRFGPIPLRSFPKRMETNRKLETLDSDHTSIRRLEDESVSFKCILVPIVTGPRRIRWEFSKNGEEFTELPLGVQNISYDEIVIERVKKIHRGYYRCSLNRISYTALLRVKDPLAAFWPFISIVSVVLILVIVILIFEKRQKAAKKAAAAEDEGTDNANDPLVPESNKLSDNENKNRAVKV